MCHAMWVAEVLEASGMTCFSGLCVGGGANWKVFIEKIRDPCCEYLIVLQTKAFFDSRPCLEEVYTAIQCNVKIIPVLFEADALEAPHWPRISSADVEAQEWLTVVKKGFLGLNSVPSPPLTVLDDQRAFFEIIDEISGDAQLDRTLSMDWQEDADKLTDVAAIAADSAASQRRLRQWHSPLAHWYGAPARGACACCRQEQAQQEQARGGATAGGAGACALPLQVACVRVRCATPTTPSVRKRCLALLLFAQGCVAFKEQRSEQARAYFAEAIELRPGLSDDRRDQGKLYHAYAEYAVAKDLLKNRRFGEAQAAFESLLDATGDAIKLLTSEQVEAAEGYLEQCKASRSVEGIKTVQEWVDAFKLKKITPMLDEMGAEGDDDDVATILELEADRHAGIAPALPELKQRTV